MKHIIQTVIQLLNALVVQFMAELLLTQLKKWLKYLEND